jgi:hypothetical protein
MTITTPAAAIPELFLARLALFGTAQSLKIANPDVPFSTTDKAYLQAAHLPNRPIDQFLDDDDDPLFAGIFQVTVVWDAGEGIIEPNEMAGKLVEFFRRGTSMWGHGMKVRVQETPTVAPHQQEPSRIRIPVTIRYEAVLTA